MGCIQKETKYIGPSLRAIKLDSGNTVQALAQDDKKGEGIVLSKQQRCNCKKVTGSQDDKRGEGIVLTKQPRCKYKKSQALRMIEGKRNVNIGSIQKETKCIGPSLRAIKPGLGNTVQALAPG